MDGLLEAIYSADLIAIGPGSLYSSVMPNLLVDGVAQALRETRALKVMVANLMTQPGETDGMDCLDHVQAVIDHVGPVLDAVLVNGAAPSPEAIAALCPAGRPFPVRWTAARCISAGRGAGGGGPPQGGVRGSDTTAARSRAAC